MMKNASDPSTYHRSRVRCFFLIVLTIALGLFLRSTLSPLPDGVNKYGGDALWATVVFFGIGFMRPQWSSSQAALVALLFSWAMEGSQLYHAPWIDRIRETLPGKLILGAVFNAPDLLAYVIGIALGLGVECGLRKRFR